MLLKLIRETQVKIKETDIALNTALGTERTKLKKDKAILSKYLGMYITQYDADIDKMLDEAMTGIIVENAINLGGGQLDPNLILSEDDKRFSTLDKIWGISEEVSELLNDEQQRIGLFDCEDCVYPDEIEALQNIQAMVSRELTRMKLEVAPRVHPEDEPQGIGLC